MDRLELLAFAFMHFFPPNGEIVCLPNCAANAAIESLQTRLGGKTTAHAPV